MSAKRKAAIEARLREGYAPFRVSGGLGSSVEKAAKDLRILSQTLSNWVKRHHKFKEQEKPNFCPDWSLWNLETTRDRVPAIPRAARRWLLTAAQNDTQVHERFWTNLKTYAAYLDAQVLVGPFTYQLGVFTDHTTRNNEFAELVRPDLRFERSECGDVLFCAEMNTLPTAVRPLSGLASYSQGRWAVFPHAKVSLETVPAMPGSPPPIIMTTGCCTVENYIPKKAGMKARFHHVIGATLVEQDVFGRHFCRQLNALEDGSFQDLDRAVASGKVTPGKRVAAITWGDIHAAKLEPTIAAAAWGIDSKTMMPTADRGMIDELKPFDQFFHDLFDGESVNHWIDSKPIERYNLFVDGKLNVAEEVKQAVSFLRASQRSWCHSRIVESNHDCLSMDTEALTKRGWLSFDEISKDDKILSFDHAAGVAKWSPITSKLSRLNNEPMVHAKGTPVDMLTTPRHRVLHKRYRVKKGWDKHWSYILASKLPTKFAIPVSAPSGLGDYDIADEWLTLAGWLLTDGCISQGKVGRPRIFFSQSKPCPLLEMAFERLGLKPTVRTRISPATHICGRRLLKAPLPNRIYGLSTDDTETVLAIIPKKREMPEWIWRLSDRQFNVFLTAVIDGDGSWCGRKDLLACAVVHGREDFLSNLQAACVAHGWRAHLSIAREKDYRLNLTKTSVWTANRSGSVVEAPSEKYVWCLQTPLTNFMVRRKGKAFFTGNCWIDRWLQKPAGDDLTNAEAYHRWNLAALSAARFGDRNFSVFRHVLKETDEHGLEGIDFIPEGSSFKICADRGGIECGLHGHAGPNGVRGTTANLSRMGTKINKGHSHTAEIFDGAYSAGVFGPNRRLLKGPTTHTPSLVVTYTTGKRTIITMQNGAWRA